MNFYALNAAPINGWETHLGSGQVAMSLAASGEARTADAHYGTGHGIMEFRAWDIPKSYSTYHGSGTAGMRLAAAGAGTIIAKNGGTAAVQIQAQGAGRNATRVYGEGVAAMSLIASRVVSEQHRQIKGEGAATMAIQASARDNRVIMLPSSFSPAPKARGLRVATENRAMRVPRQPVAHQLAEA